MTAWLQSIAYAQAAPDQEADTGPPAEGQEIVVTANRHLSGAERVAGAASFAAKLSADEASSSRSSAVRAIAPTTYIFREQLQRDWANYYSLWRENPLANDPGELRQFALKDAELAARDGQIDDALVDLFTLGPKLGLSLASESINLGFNVVDYARGNISGKQAILGSIPGSRILGFGERALVDSARAAREAEAAEEAVPDGIVYLRKDATEAIAPYGGQTTEANYLARQAAHNRAFPDSEFQYTIVDRAQPGAALDIAEHNFIQELTGGVAARRSSAVSNLRDPVGARRRPSFGLPEPR